MVLTYGFLCTRFDGEVDSLLRTALACDFDERQRAVMALPRSSGGLGIPQTRVVAPEAYNASSDATAPTQRTAAGLRSADMIASLHKSDPVLGALVSAQGKKYASAWMTATTRYMAAHDARIALRLRSGIPLRAATCGCGASCSAPEFAHHVLGCAANRGYTVSSRHNAVRDALASIARRCCVPVRTEPPQFEGKDGRRPDITFFFSDEAPWTVDLHVNTPTAASHLGKDCTSKSTAAKDRKYRTTVEGAQHRWLTLGFETFGGWRQGPVELASKLATVSNGAVPKKEIVETIAVVLQAGNAAIVSSTLAMDRLTDGRGLH